MQRFVVKWLRPFGPIYQWEAKRGAVAKAHIRVRSGCMVSFILLCTLAFLSILAAFGFVFNLLNLLQVVVLTTGMAMPVVIFILRLRVVSAAGDTLLYEKDNGTWDMLYILPLSAAQLLRAKYAGGLVRMRHMFYQIFGSYIVFFVITLFFTISQFHFYIYSYYPDPFTELNSPLSWMAVAAAVVYYSLLEPLLSYLTESALGLAISTFAPTRGIHEAAALVLGVLSIGSTTWLMVWMTEQLIDRQWAIFCAAVPLAASLRYAALHGLLALAIWRTEHL